MTRNKDFEQAALDNCADWSHCHYFEAGCEHGYQYAKKMIEDYLLCVELSYFFPTVSDEDADKGKEALAKAIKEFLEEM